MPVEIFANHSISITELKKNPMTVVELGEPVVVLNRNTPVFYCVSPELYEQMINALEDAELTEIVNERKDQPAVRLDIKEL